MILILSPYGSRQIARHRTHEDYDVRSISYSVELNQGTHGGMHTSFEYERWSEKSWPNILSPSSDLSPVHRGLANNEGIPFRRLTCPLHLAYWFDFKGRDGNVKRA